LNPLRKLINNFKPKMQHNFIGAESFATNNPYSLLSAYSSDAYASAFPSIRAISQEYMAIRPFAIDANGKPVKSEITDALYHPNQLDSSVSFFEKMAVSTLVLPKTYILVWRRDGNSAKPGGNFTKDKIAGFTFLEHPSVERKDGRTYYNVGAQQFNDREVMVLPGGVNPHNLYGGYSPSEAARRWAKLDDYIADFQTGFFENNAIPAGQFIITAASKKDYEDTVAMMQDRHRGAGNNGNVTYAPRPLDESGKPANPKIEWIPFAQSNKDIDFKNLFEQTNNRIDQAFGVSQFIKGVDDAPNYATAQVSQANFSKRAVYPLALRNYTQITHEINRITGGVGVAITFKYDIPTVADAEKVEAETKNYEADLIVKLTDKGWSLDSIIEAFELSNARKLLKTGTPTKIENDKPDVDEGGEVEKSPDPSKIDGVTPLNKAELTNEQKLEKATRDFMQAQVDRAITEFKEDAQAKMLDPEPTEDELDVFVTAMFATISVILIAKGQEEYGAGTALVAKTGFDTSTLQGFKLTEATESSYRAYLSRVGTSYGQDTAESIRSVLANADEVGLNRSETEKALKEVMNTDDWRVERMGRSELNRAEAQGQLEGMKELAAETGLEFEKVWKTEADPCPYCDAMEGTTVPIDQPFIPEGGSIEGTDGKILVNDFVSIETADAHPNCECTLVYEVVS